MTSPRSNVSRISHQLNNPNSVTHGALTTLATAGLALVNPKTLTPGKRFLYRSALAGLSGWMTWAVMNPEQEGYLPAGIRGSSTIAAAGVTMGVADLSEKLDGKLHDGLVRRGVKKPRLVFAAAALVIGGLSWWVGRKGSGNDASFGWNDTDDAYEGPETVEMPDQIRDLTEFLLKSTRKFGSKELRQQLKTAKVEYYEGEEEGFYPGLGFAVEDDVPLAVPGNGTFPVIGRYTALGGKTFDLYLTVVEGKLDTLSVSEGGDWSDDEMGAWYDTGQSTQNLGRWPEPGELELLIETPEGFRSVQAA